MKFKDNLSKKLFLSEINKIDLVKFVDNGYIIPHSLLEEYVSLRKKTDVGLKDFRKSQDQKNNWRKNRYNIKRGLRGFHKSTEGKRFHRNLARHVIMGKTKSKLANKSEALKSISSVKTHLFIECCYYHPILEQIELENLIYDIPNIFKEIEDSILKDKALDEELENIVFSLLETSAVVKSFAEKSGKSVDEVEKMWSDISKSLTDSGLSDDEPKFYGVLVKTLKNKLNIK